MKASIEGVEAFFCSFFTTYDRFIPAYVTFIPLPAHGRLEERQQRLVAIQLWHFDGQIAKKLWADVIAEILCACQMMSVEA